MGAEDFDTVAKVGFVVEDDVKFDRFFSVEKIDAVKV